MDSLLWPPRLACMSMRKISLTSNRAQLLSRRGMSRTAFGSVLEMKTDIDGVIADRQVRVFRNQIHHLHLLSQKVEDHDAELTLYLVLYT